MNGKHGFTRRGVMRGSAVGLLLAGAAYAATTITVGNVMVDVGGGAPVNAVMNFPVTRSGDASAPVTVNYATVDGNARAGFDYVPAVGSIVLAAGATSGTIPVNVTGASTITPDRQFSLVLLDQGGNGPFPSFGPLSYFSTGGTAGTGAVRSAKVQALPRGATGAGVVTSSPAQGSIVAADFNGDGKLDVAVENEAGTGFSIYLNTSPAAGTIAFAQGVASAVGLRAPLTVADFNGDGLPDLAGMSSGGPVVMLNTTPVGASTVSFGASYSLVSLGAVADLNGDGKPDFVQFSGAGLVVEINTTATGASVPSFTEYPLPYAGLGSDTATAITVGDFDGDGKPDIATIMQGAGPAGIEDYIAVRLNTTPSGSLYPRFTNPATFDVYEGVVTAFFAADLNNDGKSDLVTSGSPNAFPTESGLSLLLSTAASGATQPSFQLLIMNSDLPIAMADLNGDGKPDYIMAASQPGVVPFMLNVAPPGSGALMLTSPYSTTIGGVDSTQQPSGSAVAIADFDGDGKPDLAFQAGQELAVALNTTQPGPGMQAGAANDAATGTIHYQSNTPQPFGFTAVGNAIPNTLYQSNAVTPTGFNVAAPISVSGGQYSINCGPFTSSAGMLQPNDSVRAQVLSSASYNTSTSATVTIGGVKGTFSVTTGDPYTTGTGDGSGACGTGSSSGAGSSSGSSSGGSSSSSGGHGSSSGGTSSSSSGSSSSSTSSSGGSNGGAGSGGGGAFSPFLFLGLGLARLRRGRRRLG